MNTCTYVTGISMQPKLFAIAIYNNTRTLDNMLRTETAVLQWLHPQQYALVRYLGKKSGRNFDKHTYLHKKQLLTEWQGMPVLKEAAALVLLRKINHQPTGDHVLFTFEALRYKTFTPDVLTTAVLREKNIISV